MSTKTVETPDGPMYETGFIHFAGVVFIDCFLAFSLLFLLLGSLELFGLHFADSIKWFPGALIFIYLHQTSKHNLPSLGNWALGLRRYHTSEVTGGADYKEHIRVAEKLPLHSRIGRLVTAVVIIGVLFTVFWKMLV